MTTTHIAGVARAAMLVHLEITTYTGRKQDKKTTGEVTAAKHAQSSRASSVYKNLFAECKELAAITKHASYARNVHSKLTLPWHTRGPSILPVASLMDYTDEMNKCDAEFQRLVGLFLAKYDLQVSAAAFQLGNLFDRNEYPLREEVARRFKFNMYSSPLPTSGDFRLDIEAEVQKDLADKYELDMQRRVEVMSRDMWTRLHTVLTNLSDRLDYSENAKGERVKNKFHDTLVGNAVELCDLLTKLNVTGDNELERARKSLEDAMLGVEAEDLRKEDGTRHTVKTKVDKILDAFDWGDDEDDNDDATAFDLAA